MTTSLSKFLVRMVIIHVWLNYLLHGYCHLAAASNIFCYVIGLPLIRMTPKKYVERTPASHSAHFSMRTPITKGFSQNFPFSKEEGRGPEILIYLRIKISILSAMKKTKSDVSSWPLATEKLSQKGQHSQKQDNNFADGCFFLSCTFFDFSAPEKGKINLWTNKKTWKCKSSLGKKLFFLLFCWPLFTTMGSVLRCRLERTVFSDRPMCHVISGPPHFEVFLELRQKSGKSTESSRFSDAGEN